VSNPPDLNQMESGLLKRLEEDISNVANELRFIYTGTITVLMETPIVCPYSWDHAIEPIPDAEVVAKNGSGEHRVLTAHVFRCGLWHIFAVFPQPTLQERQAYWKAPSA
jgi:hypothetical protein